MFAGAQNVNLFTGTLKESENKGGMMNKKIKKKYDGMSLSGIETDITLKKESSLKSRKEFIEGLYYLETTKRFRDDKKYKNSQFSTYIMDKFQLRITTYHKEKFAFLKFPEASEKHGPGLINKVKSRCGVGNVQKIIKEIETKPDISRENIEKLIEKNTTKERPELPKAPTYRELQFRVIELEAENKKLSDEVGKHLDQIERLKSTVGKLKQYEKAMLDLQKMAFSSQINTGITHYAAHCK